MRGRQNYSHRLKALTLGLALFFWLGPQGFLWAEEPLSAEGNEPSVIEDEGAISLPSVTPEEEIFMMDPSQDPNMREGKEDEADSSNAVPFSMNQNSWFNRDSKEPLWLGCPSSRIPASESAPVTLKSLFSK